MDADNKTLQIFIYISPVSPVEEFLCWVNLFFQGAIEKGTPYGSTSAPWGGPDKPRMNRR